MSTIEFASSLTKYSLMPAFYPEITPSSDKYPLLVSYGGGENFRNTPGQYHNGGLWPVVTSFWVLASRLLGYPQFAEMLHDGIRKSNHLANFGYHEFIDANDGKPGGMRGQAWSAAAELIGSNEGGLVQYLTYE
jgi:glycogen debranching enzyme